MRRFLVRVVSFFFVWAWLAPGALRAADFAPLTVGNTWDYTGREEVWSKYIQDVRNIRRHLTVDSQSIRTGPSPATLYHLTCRDSLTQRAAGRFPNRNTAALPDSVVVRGFIVANAAGRPLAIERRGAEPLPFGIAPFFRVEGLPQDPQPVRYRSGIPRCLADSAVYASGIGMLASGHDYNVWNSYGYTAPWHTFAFSLKRFNGIAEDPGNFPAPRALGEAITGDYLPMVPGTAWRYAGFRFYDSLGVISKDSLHRTLAVGSGPNAGVLLLTDSLFHRLRNGLPIPDAVLGGTFELDPDSVSFRALSLGLGDWRGQSNTPFTDLARFFPAARYPESMQSDLELKSGRVRAVVHVEGADGIFADTLVYASGFGMIRCRRTLADPRRFEETFVLTGFRGEPFDAAVVSLARPEAGGKAGAGRTVRRERAGADAEARIPVKHWRGRDPAGRRVAGKR